MYKVSIKITKKNSEKDKEVISLKNEGFESYEKVREHGLKFLKDNKVPDIALDYYGDSTNVGDIGLCTPLNFRYYNKNIEGYSLKIDVEITLNI